MAKKDKDYLFQEKSEEFKKAQANILLTDINKNPYMPEDPHISQNKNLNTTKKNVIGAINEIFSMSDEAYTKMQNIAGGKYVQTVNGIKPNKNGDVEISGAKTAQCDAQGRRIEQTYATIEALNNASNLSVKTVNTLRPDAEGNVTISSVDTATKAYRDGSNNIITATYARKAELNNYIDQDTLDRFRNEIRRNNEQEYMNMQNVFALVTDLDRYVMKAEANLNLVTKKELSQKEQDIYNNIDGRYLSHETASKFALEDDIDDYYKKNIEPHFDDYVTAINGIRAVDAKEGAITLNTIEMAEKDSEGHRFSEYYVSKSDFDAAMHRVDVEFMPVSSMPAYVTDIQLRQEGYLHKDDADYNYAARAKTQADIDNLQNTIAALTKRIEELEKKDGGNS